MHQGKRKHAEDPRAEFDVLIYKDDAFLQYSREYLGKLRRLIKHDAVLRITDGSYDEPKRTLQLPVRWPVELTFR